MLACVGTGCTHVSHQTIVTTRLLPLLPMQQPAQLARRRREQEELEGGAGKRWGMCGLLEGPQGAVYRVLCSS